MPTTGVHSCFATIYSNVHLRMARAVSSEVDQTYYKEPEIALLYWYLVTLSACCSACYYFFQLPLHPLMQYLFTEIYLKDYIIS